MKDQRTFAPEDLFELKFLQNAHFSPDGTQVIYTVSHVETSDDPDEEKEYQTIWLLTLATGKARQMTTGKALDGSPRISPDGTQIAFVSDRGDSPQIYTLPIHGGEATQITNLKQGAGGVPQWSPDGSKIAFTAKPTFDSDKPLDLSKRVYRVTRPIYRFDAMGYLDQLVQAIHLVDLASGETTQLTDDGGNYHSLQWSPDGSRMLALVNMKIDSFIPFFSQLCVVDLAGGVEPLSAETVGVAGATWSSDGTKIVYVGGLTTGVPIGTKSDLFVMDVATKESENRTAGLAVGAGGMLTMRMPTPVLSEVNLPLSSDGSAAFVRVQEGGNLHVYRVALSGAEAWSAVVSGERVCSILDSHDDQLLLAVGDANRPPNLALANTDGNNERQVTQINQHFLDQMTLPEIEHLHFTGTDGVAVEGWYMKPTNEAVAPHPTILYIHGGPHVGYGNGFSFDFQMLAGLGYGVLYINHRASTGYGDAFATAIKGDWGNLDYGDLMTGVDCAIAQGLADEDRLGCAGTSGGGNLSTWIVGQTDRFKAAIPQNPVTNWHSFYGTSDVGIWFAVEQMGGHPHEMPEVYAKCSPITYAHRCTTPTLLVQSEHDWRCPAEQSEQFYTALKANGCVVEMLRQPGGPHGASIRGTINARREHLLAMVDWFGKYV